MHARKITKLGEHQERHNLIQTWATILLFYWYILFIIFNFSLFFHYALWLLHLYCPLECVKFWHSSLLKEHIFLSCSVTFWYLVDDCIAAKYCFCYTVSNYKSNTGSSLFFMSWVKNNVILWLKVSHPSYLI